MPLPPTPWWTHPPDSLLEVAPALRGTHRARHVVIGAGIAGASLATELSKRIDGVVLLDAARPGAGATGRNAGFLLAESDCYDLAATRHGETAARALRDLGLATRRVVRGLIRRGHDVGFRPTGSLRLALDDEEADSFRATARQRLRGVRLVVHDSIPEAGALPGVRAALLDERDGVVHPLRLLAAILRAGEDRGVRRHDGSPVVTLDRRGRTWTVETSLGTVRTDHVTLATAATTSRFVDPSLLPAVRPVRAQMLAARLDPAPVWVRPVYASQGGDYWRLLDDGTLLLGGRRRTALLREETASDRPTAAVQGSLDALLRALLPDADGVRIDVTHRWAGTMTFTADGLPVAGQVEGTRGLSVLTGLNGHGMGWAPGLARCLAAEIVDGEPVIPLPFRVRSSGG